MVGGTWGEFAARRAAFAAVAAAEGGAVGEETGFASEAPEGWALSFTVRAGLASVGARGLRLLRRGALGRCCALLCLSGIVGLGAADGLVALLFVPGFGEIGGGVSLEGAAFAVGFGYEAGAGLAGLGDEFGDAGRGFAGVAFGGYGDGLGVVRRGGGYGEEGGEFAADVEDGLAFDGYGLELAGGHERVDGGADTGGGGGRGGGRCDLVFAWFPGPGPGKGGWGGRAW